MNPADVAAWLNSLTDKEFTEFFYQALASRHIYPLESGYVDSHLVLANAHRDREEAGQWNEWQVEFICPADGETWASDSPLCQFGWHCGLTTVSWAKNSACPVCGGDVYGT